MDYRALATELTTDPVALGYAALTDAQAAAKLNATSTGRTLPRTAVPVQEVYNNIVNADWPAAASASESKLQALLGMQSVDASNANTKAIIASIFGAATQTRTNLQALAAQPVSRATELGLGIVLESDVTRARAGTGW